MTWNSFTQSSLVSSEAIQLTMQNCSGWTKSYTLGVVIDLSKAFDTVDHNVLINRFMHNVVKWLNIL